MDLLPDITMPTEVKEDLAIIETEDLKSDPFERAPPIKPDKPSASPKPKKQVSEKQKAHLANARKLAKERKEKAKKDKEQEKKQDIKEYAQVISTENDIGTATGTAPSQGPNGFEQWLGFYNQFADIQKEQEEQERIRREEQERKEKELEAKYFAKFQEKYNLDNTQKDVGTAKPTPRRLPKTSLDILAPPQPKDDFGPFGGYF